MPGSSRVSTDSLTYESYFGLNEKPFSLNADPRFVFESPHYRATRNSLLAGIRRREGLLVLTGEIGTGKTTLCRSVVQHLGRSTYCAIVPDPFASREDLLKMLLIDFGVVSIQEFMTGSLRQASRTELGYLLADFLRSLPADAFAVVIIDEAQNLAGPLIDEVRLLADTFGSQGRLQIVFVGQPELHARLKRPDMRQVDQRVCGYHVVSPMDRTTVAGYVQHRLHVAGLRPDRVLFPEGVIELLHPRSGGVPRLVNRICDRALQIAFEHRDVLVDREILNTALIEIGAATLSPTWDSIIFSTPAAPTVAVAASTPQPAPPATVKPEAPAVAVPAPPAPAVQESVTPAVPAPAASAVPAKAEPDVTSAPEADGDHFTDPVDRWIAKDLPPARAQRQLHELFDEGCFDLPVAVTPVPDRRPHGESKHDARPRAIRRDWPRNVRSETYLRRLSRGWMKGVVVTGLIFVMVNVIVVGASMLGETLTAPALPAVPQAPAPALPGVAAPLPPGEPVAYQ